ncbi:RluA family pseudouridine synthase [Sphingomonas sp. 28-63-12]|uniref:RluA family pseudouridine synthase n=1 Tax=Sphingomonas sp. 28-63-12 TaxID=1970434 RepID=UPI000BCFF765|nr:MAG: RNA pseudouridine synthase [Sphingomonas sp. 28-63-12]
MITDHVLFIDGEAIVIDKPAGLPVDPPRDGALSLENHLQSLTFGFQRWPQAVHRLDRDTSGCLLLSRNPKAHKRFQRVFEAGLVKKTYLAVLDGIPEGEGGLIDLALDKISSEADGWRMIGSPKGKPSRTHWRLLRVIGAQSLVEFSPETGRTHQIRVHAAEALGAPVAGDPVYGQLFGRKGAHGLLLHAAALIVPREGKPDVIAEAPMPDRFIAAGFGPAAPIDAEPMADLKATPMPDAEPSDG